MINKIIISLSFAFIVSLSANYTSCSPELQRYYNSIVKVPEAKMLIDTIHKEGPIHIEARNTDLSNQFGAFWDPDNRIICVAMHPERSAGSIIGSILFELHNASVNCKLDHYDRLAYDGKIQRDHYIESMEYLEYINSLNAAKIAESGIKQGHFPRDARLPTYSTFQQHFAIQKQYGHSAHFGRNYDRLCHRNRHMMQTNNQPTTRPKFG